MGFTVATGTPRTAVLVNPFSFVKAATGLNRSKIPCACCQSGTAWKAKQSPGLFGMPPSSAAKRPPRLIAALTESAELSLGTIAPKFELPEPLTGKTVSLADFRDAKALLVIFMCVHCPFVKHLKEALVDLANDYKDKAVKVVGISSNSVQIKPQDAPDHMAADAKCFGYPFPFLYDETQEVAKAFQAVTTPEIFLFDKDLKLQYHGQFDSSRPSNSEPITGQDVRRAIDSILQGKEPPAKVMPSIGCNIKWHPGNTPSYAQ